LEYEQEDSLNVDEPIITACRGICKNRYCDLKNNILYLVWYLHGRRAETLSRELGAKLVFVYEARLRSFWLRPLGYIIQGWNTWRLLEAERPALVITQSPPVFAPVAVALWCKLRGRKRASYILDCHPGTFYQRYWRWALPLIRPLARGAVVSLLCNEDAQNYLSKWHTNYLFLPDGLPDLSSGSCSVGTEGDARIAVISTFEKDEPILELLEAACLTPHVTYYLTGDLRRATKEMYAIKPENVIFTGYLQGGVYNGLLHNVQGIMVLSNLKSTLSCGAFEALSLAKPTIISNTPEQSKWFSNGFIMVENTREGIAQGVDKLLSEYATYSYKAELLREDYISARQPKLEKLASLLKY
jgi:glycosyltransferase involved in cell wall biosynthesis